MPGRLKFEFQFRAGRENSQRRGDTPMRMLIMGDFSGKAARNAANSDQTRATCPIIPIDIDNFEDVMRRLTPQVNLTLSDRDTTRVNIQFNELDDFHPDTLFEDLGLFAALRDTRQRLNEPASFPQAAAALRFEAKTPPLRQTESKNALAEAEKPLPLEESNDDLFERLLGKPASLSQGNAQDKAANVQKAEAGLQGFINRLVAPYIVPEADPLQPQYVAAVDESLSQQMRAILHAPAFQAMEAIWRATGWLVSNLDTGETLKLFLLDITKEELAADIDAANGNLEATQCYRTIIEKGVNTLAGESWSLLLGCYRFGPDKQDLSLLAALGAIASQAGGPFIAQAEAKLLGCRNLIDSPNPRDWNTEDKKAADRWQALRHSAVAPWIGLALPRILLRLPYGKNTDEVERFVFEEITTIPDHEQLLWGNPAFACALLIATSFQEQGWKIQEQDWKIEPGDISEITDLPALVYEEDSEKQLQACAELYLSEIAAESILDKGIMPLVSFRNRNAARLLRFQSIAEPIPCG